MAFLRWVKVLDTRVSQPNPGIPFRIQPEGKELVLLKDFQGNWKSWEPVCPHEKASLRGLRPDSDNCITCPLHRYSFSLENGHEKHNRVRLYLYPVEERNSEVFVGL